MRTLYSAFLAIAMAAVGLGTMAACTRPAAEVVAPAAPTGATSAAALANAGPLPPGATAPDFALVDTAGQTHRLADLRGKVVVLEWFNPDCPFVKVAHEQGTLTDAAQRWSSRGVVWLAINSGAAGKQGTGAARNHAAREAWRLAHPVLIDEAGTVGQAFGARRTPEVFVIGSDGKIAYHGAPYQMGEGQDAVTATTIRYLDDALDDILGGKPVRLPRTQPVGCSVKYAAR